ncbi:unknown [Bacteroides sp. CAG:754]|nr:unknown [Bacteroides sp. CAG:754]
METDNLCIYYYPKGIYSSLKKYIHHLPSLNFVKETHLSRPLRLSHIEWFRREQ